MHNNIILIKFYTVIKQMRIYAKVLKKKMGIRLYYNKS